jgi:hypothetical protein
VVAKFIKRLQKIIYLPIPKIVIYCIPPPSLTTMGCCIAPWTSKFRGPDVLDSPQRHQLKEPPPSSGFAHCRLTLAPSPCVSSWILAPLPAVPPSPPSRPRPPPIAILHLVVDLGLLHQGREARPAPPSAIPAPPPFAIPAHPPALLGSPDLQSNGHASHAFAPE